MIEFGARLSLKDNMSANIQKNLKMQKKFSDQVNRTSESVKRLGKTKASPTLNLKDRATAILKKVKDGLKAVGNTTVKAVVAVKDTATAGLSKIGSILGTLAKGVTVAIGIAGAGASLIVGNSISEGASLQQSVGGVETLYKGDAGLVTANADKAYKTAGLSANAYMETVTSFSASLLQSLGGDTAKSAQIADMAIIDMADNANKFGTDMASIQNAYQGFAKQNYTMLDNLKLGYGGTQEEMQRLLKDATKLSGVEYDIGNLADVYNAIHVIQEKGLGITGATKDEAEKTFSGSFASMKASISNLFGNMSLGGDITGSMQDVVETASTFLFNNAIPMIGNVFKALPNAIKTAIKSASPKIKEQGGEIVNSLKEGLISMLPASIGGAVENAFSSIGNIANSVAPLIQQIGDMFGRVAPIIADTLGGAFENSGGFIQTLVDMVSNSIPIVEGIITGLAEAFTYVLPVVMSLGEMFADVFPDILGVVGAVIPAVLPIFQSLGNIIQTLIPVVTQIIQTFAGIIQQVFPIISNVITMVLNAVMPIVQSFAGLIQSALPIISNIIAVFSGVIATIFPVVQRIFQELGAKISAIISGIIVPIVQKLGAIFEKISPIIQSAIEIVSSVLSTAWDIISPILDLLMTTFELVWQIIEPIIDGLVEGFVWLWDMLEPIFSGISEGLSLVGDAIGGVADFVSSGVDTIAGWFGFAYGKDRVPYDNYPAMLHQGEKVLTRNQADQYERAMNTRGVQLTYAENVGSGGNLSANTVTPVQGEQKQEFNFSPTLNFAGANFNEMGDMEKVADQTIEIFMERFRKIMPNMA